MGAGKGLEMTSSDFMTKGIIALLGCFAAAYIGQEILGASMLGYLIGTAILAGTAGPFLFAVLRWCKEKHALRTKKL